MITNRFAIKIGTSKKHKAFAKVIKKISKFYNNLKVEGLNCDYRGEKKSVDSINVSSRGVTVAVKKEEKNYLCIGFSNKFDISFETFKNISILEQPIIPILDIKSDYKEILRRLGLYLGAHFPETTSLNEILGWKTPVVVERFSHYVSLNNIPISYKKFNKIKKEATNKKLVKKLIDFLF